MLKTLQQPTMTGGGECPAACQAITSEIHQLSETLGKAIDAKDHFTSQHSEQVAVLAQAIALGMKLSPSQADYIHIAGHLHDIGKIGIADEILLKSGRLSETDWWEIKRHPEIGARIIAPVHFFKNSGIVDMVMHHHEDFNGRGYPGGLKGEEIPLGARIIAVADSLSAMLQNRPYRPSLPLELALREIENLSGVRYDPQVVGVLFRDIDGLVELLANLGLVETAANPSPPGEMRVVLGPLHF